MFDPSIELEEIKAWPVPAPHHAFRGPSHGSSSRHYAMPRSRSRRRI
jgi:hypothetical protein